MNALLQKVVADMIFRFTRVKVTHKEMHTRRVLRDKTHASAKTSKKFFCSVVKYEQNTKKKKKKKTRTHDKRRRESTFSSPLNTKEGGLLSLRFYFFERERLKRDLSFLSSLLSFVRAWRGVWREQCPSEQL